MTALEKAIEQLAKEPLLEWLQEDCIWLLNEVHDKFFQHEDDIRMVERKFLFPIHGVMDLVLYRKDRFVVRDWKVSKKLDDRWKLRQRRSKQFALYAATIFNWFDEIPLLEVVGLNVEENDKTGKRKVNCEVLELEYTIADLERAGEEIEGIKKELSVLDPTRPWPKNESGCRCFGDMYKCLFEDICWGKKNNSSFSLDNVPEISYTGITEFFRCQERLRLLKCKEWEEEPSPALALGKAFHNAVAEMYRTKERNDADSVNPC